MIRIPDKYHLPLILLVCFILFCMHLDVMYENIMEARNFITAREMLNYDNWVFTTMNGEARYEKPPLPTWLVAISAAVFGLDQIWALRLPSALIATLMAIYLYKLAVKFVGNKTYALNSVLILVTSFYILFSGRNGTWDIFAHSFMLGGIYFLFRFFSDYKKEYQNAILSGIFIGLSFMSKGPVSHYALLLPFLIAYGAVYKFSGFKGKIIPLLILLLITLILSSWWAIAIYLFDTASASAIADKEATAWANRNTRPFYYYWSFFTQSGIWTIPAFIGLLYPYLKSRVINLKAYQFTLVWTLAVVVLLSLIPEKKSRYLLPVLIPLAFNTSFYIEYLQRRFKDLKDKRELIPVYFNFGLIAVIGISVPIAGYLIMVENLDGLWLWFVLVSLAALTIGLLIIKGIWEKAFSRMFYLTIAFVCSIILFGFPLVKASYTNEDYAKLAPKIENLQTDGIPVYLYENSSPELIWDMKQRLPIIKTSLGLTFPKEQHFAVLVDKDKAKELEQDFADYNVNLEYEIDGNITSKKDRNYKARRIGRLYLIESRSK